MKTLSLTSKNVVGMQPPHRVRFKGFFCGPACLIIIIITTYVLLIWPHKICTFFSIESAQFFSLQHDWLPSVHALCLHLVPSTVILRWSHSGPSLPCLCAPVLTRCSELPQHATSLHPCQRHNYSASLCKVTLMTRPHCDPP